MIKKYSTLIIVIVVIVAGYIGIGVFKDARIEYIHGNFHSDVESIDAEDLAEFPGVMQVEVVSDPSALENGNDYDRYEIRVLMDESKTKTPRGRAQETLSISRKLWDMIDKYGVGQGYDNLTERTGFIYHGKQHNLHLDLDIRCIYGKLECFYGTYKDKYYEWNESGRGETIYRAKYDEDGILTTFELQEKPTFIWKNNDAGGDKPSSGSNDRANTDNNSKNGNYSNHSNQYNTNNYPINDPEDYDDPDEYADDAWGEDFDDWYDAYDYWEDY